jgi:transposase
VILFFKEDYAMGLPLSSDLRRRFRELIDTGNSARAAARQLLISPASGVRLAAKLRRGENLDPLKQGRPAGTGKLEPHQAFLTESIEQDPDITLFELRDALTDAEGLRVHHASIARFLARLGFTYKKNRWWQMNGANRGSAMREPNGSRAACR